MTNRTTYMSNMFRDVIFSENNKILLHNLAKGLQAILSDNKFICLFIKP